MKIKEQIENIKPYLPSERFLTNFGICLGTALSIFVFTKLPSHFENIGEKQHIKKQFAGITVGEITRKDTDGDGVADWEEYLWGTSSENTDSDSDGISDLDYINQKKRELQEKTGTTGIESETVTDQLAREYFATIVALQESGGLTVEAMTNIATSFAENISLVELPNMFNSASVVSVTPTIQTRTKYKNDISARLTSNGSGSIGTEFNYIDQLTRDEYSRDSARASIEGIANSYKSFAVSISQMQVPNDIVEEHIAFVNALYNTGLSLETTSAFWDDPISGVTGLMQYKNYSYIVEESLTFFEDYFSKNGIL